MKAVPARKSYIAYVVLWVGLFLALPLWREFHEPGQVAWNVFLAVFLVALVALTFLGVRHLQKNRIEVGEALFTSAERKDR